MTQTGFASLKKAMTRQKSHEKNDLIHVLKIPPQLVSPKIYDKANIEGNCQFSPFNLELWVNCMCWCFQLFFTYFRGKQTANFKVITGEPLPFSFDILSPALQYGNRCFTKYPEGMPDYFKQAFPAGMSYERTFTFEDGGVATASGHIRYVMNYKCG